MATYTYRTSRNGTPRGRPTDTPATFAFSNEYDQHISLLSRMWNAFIEWDRNLSGNGSHTNWNGDGLIQFYRTDGYAFGQAIHAKGRPQLIDINEMPGFMGLAGRGGRSRYIGRPHGATVANDLLGAAGLGAKSFQIGYNSKLLDFAIEAVKGNVGAANRPVVGIATSESVQMVEAIKTKPPQWVSRHVGEINNGFVFSRDSFENGKIEYKKILFETNIEQDADSVSWINSLYK